MTRRTWMSVIAVLVIVISGIAAVRWDDAHRTVDLEQSPWVRAVAGQEEGGAERIYARPIVLPGGERRAKAEG